VVKTSSNVLHTSRISPTTHEEADTRLLLHVNDAAAAAGHTHIMIVTIDSDVAMLAVFAYDCIPNLEELWIEFGVGKKRTTFHSML